MLALSALSLQLFKHIVEILLLKVESYLMCEVICAISVCKVSQVILNSLFETLEKKLEIKNVVTTFKFISKAVVT